MIYKLQHHSRCAPASKLWPRLLNMLEARWIGDTHGEVEYCSRIVEMTWIKGPTILFTHLISIHIMRSYRATLSLPFKPSVLFVLVMTIPQVSSSAKDISTQIQLDISSALSKHQIALRSTVGRVSTLLMLTVNCRAPQPLQDRMMPGWVRMKDIEKSGQLFPDIKHTKSFPPQPG